jgi:hypothetical protein
MWSTDNNGEPAPNRQQCRMASADFTAACLKHGRYMADAITRRREEKRGRPDVRNPNHMSERSGIGDDAPLRPDGSVPASGAAKRRLVIECTTTLRAARVDSKRLVFAKSQQFNRLLTTLWRTFGVRADCRLLIDEARMRRGSGAARPPYGKIKAARCGPVGWLKSARISAPLHEVHFALQPPFSDNARKINVRRTSREVASRQPTSGRKDKNAAVGRSHEIGRIEVICWHVAGPCRRFRRKRQSFQQAQRHRRSPCDGLESESVAPRILRPFCPAPVSWHTRAMARPHKSRRFADLLKGLAGHLVGGPETEK